MRIDIHSDEDDAHRSRGYAQELVGARTGHFLGQRDRQRGSIASPPTSAWETRRSALGLHTELAQSQQ